MNLAGSRHVLSRAQTPATFSSVSARPAPLCRIIHWIGQPSSPSSQGPSRPAQISSPQPTVTPITHPPLDPRTPAAVDFSRSDCRCHKTVHPSDPIVIRYQVTYWLYSPDQGLFSLPLGLLIICHHRPRPRGGLARPNPPFRFASSRTPPWESRIAGPPVGAIACLPESPR